MNKIMTFLPFLVLLCVYFSLKSMAVQAADLPRALFPQPSWAVESHCGCTEHPLGMEAGT